MRLLAGLAIACCASGAVQAQAAPDAARSRLMDAAFAPRTAISSPLLDREAVRPGKGVVRWTTNEVSLGRGAALRVSVGGALATPGGLPLDLDRAEFSSDAYEVAVTRDWPSAVRFEAGAYDLDMTPHAGLGVSSTGGQAEAGATLTLGQRASDAVEDRLRSLGVRDGAAFGDQGRWYLFAAASGRAVGLNMLRNDGDWDRAGWTTDPSSQLIGDAQVGVGWRKGALQSSFGYIHREVRSERMLLGQEGRDDSMVAFSLSIKPR